MTVRDVADFGTTARKSMQWRVSTNSVSTNRCPRHSAGFLRLARREWYICQPIRQSRSKNCDDKRWHQKVCDRAEVRRLLREVELGRIVRAAAIFSLLLYTGCRVGDLVALELHDLILGERSGSATFRMGKGRKQRTVPLPLAARKALQTYLESRPPINSDECLLGSVVH